MKCKDIRYDYIDYVKGMLSDDKMSMIDDHLTNCESCRKEIEEIKNFSRTLDNYQVSTPNDSFFINFIPRLNERIDGRTKTSYSKKVVNFVLSFSTLSSVIILVIILMQVGHQDITTDTGIANNVSIENPKIKENEPRTINYENYVRESLISDTKSKQKIEQKATETFASAALNEHGDVFLSRENIASLVNDLSDEEVDQVIEKLKTKDILQ
jgi:hypothetical protein